MEETNMASASFAQGKRSLSKKLSSKKYVGSLKGRFKKFLSDHHIRKSSRGDDSSTSSHGNPGTVSTARRGSTVSGFSLGNRRDEEGRTISDYGSHSSEVVADKESEEVDKQMMELEQEQQKQKEEQEKWKKKNKRKSDSSSESSPIKGKNLHKKRMSDIRSVGSLSGRIRNEEEEQEAMIFQEEARRRRSDAVVLDSKLVTDSVDLQQQHLASKSKRKRLKLLLQKNSKRFAKLQPLHLERIFHHSDNDHQQQSRTAFEAQMDTPRYSNFSVGDTAPRDSNFSTTSMSAADLSHNFNLYYRGRDSSPIALADSLVQSDKLVSQFSDTSLAFITTQRSGVSLGQLAAEQLRPTTSHSSASSSDSNATDSELAEERMDDKLIPVAKASLTSSTGTSSKGKKPKRLRSTHFDQEQGLWKCRRCGWAYRVPEPGPEDRREHRLHCDEILKVRLWLGSQEWDAGYNPDSQDAGLEKLAETVDEGEEIEECHDPREAMAFRNFSAGRGKKLKEREEHIDDGNAVGRSFSSAAAGASVGSSYRHHGHGTMMHHGKSTNKVEDASVSVDDQQQQQQQGVKDHQASSSGAGGEAEGFGSVVDFEAPDKGRLQQQQQEREEDEMSHMLTDPPMDQKQTEREYNESIGLTTTYDTPQQSLDDVEDQWMSTSSMGANKSKGFLSGPDDHEKQKSRLDDFTGKALRDLSSEGEASREAGAPDQSLQSDKEEFADTEEEANSLQDVTGGDAHRLPSGIHGHERQSDQKSQAGVLDEKANDGINDSANDDAHVVKDIGEKGDLAQLGIVHVEKDERAGEVDEEEDGEEERVREGIVKGFVHPDSGEILTEMEIWDGSTESTVEYIPSSAPYVNKDHHTNCDTRQGPNAAAAAAQPEEMAAVGEEEKEGRVSSIDRDGSSRAYDPDAMSSRHLHDDITAADGLSTEKPQQEKPREAIGDRGDLSRADDGRDAMTIKHLPVAAHDELSIKQPRGEEEGEATRDRSRLTRADGPDAMSSRDLPNAAIAHEFSIEKPQGEKQGGATTDRGGFPTADDLDAVSSTRHLPVAAAADDDTSLEEPGERGRAAEVTDEGSPPTKYGQQQQQQQQQEQQHYFDGFGRGSEMSGYHAGHEEDNAQAESHEGILLSSIDEDEDKDDENGRKRRVMDAEQAEETEIEHSGEIQEAGLPSADAQDEHHQINDVGTNSFMNEHETNREIPNEGEEPMEMAEDQAPPEVRTEDRSTANGCEMQSPTSNQLVGKGGKEPVAETNENRHSTGDLQHAQDEVEMTKMEIPNDRDEPMEVVEDQERDASMEGLSTTDGEDEQQKQQMSFGGYSVAFVNSFLPSFLSKDEPVTEANEDSLPIADGQAGQGLPEGGRSLDSGNADNEGNHEGEFNVKETQSLRKDEPEENVGTQAEAVEGEGFRRENSSITERQQHQHDEMNDVGIDSSIKEDITEWEILSGGDDEPMQKAINQAHDVGTEDRSTAFGQDEDQQTSSSSRPVALVKSFLPSFLQKDDREIQEPSADYRPIGTGREGKEPATEVLDGSHSAGYGQGGQYDVQGGRSLDSGDADAKGNGEKEMDVKEMHSLREDQPMGSVEAKAEAEAVDGKGISRKGSSLADGQHDHDHDPVSKVGIQSFVNEDKTKREIPSASDDEPMKFGEDQAHEGSTEGLFPADGEGKQQHVSYASRPVALVKSILPSFLQKDEAEMQTPSSEKIVGEEGKESPTEAKEISHSAADVQGEQLERDRSLEFKGEKGNCEVELNTKEMESVGKDGPMERVEAEAKIKPESEPAPEQAHGSGREDAFTSGTAFTSSLLQEVFCGEAEGEAVQGGGVTSRQSSSRADRKHEHYQMDGMGTESESPMNEDKANLDDEPVQMSEEERAPDVRTEDRSTADGQDGQQQTSYGNRPVAMMKSLLPSFLVQKDEAEVQMPRAADQPMGKKRKEPSAEGGDDDSYFTGDVQDGQDEVETKGEIPSGGDEPMELAEGQVADVRKEDISAADDQEETKREFLSGGDEPMEVAEDQEQAPGVRKEDISSADGQDEQHQISNVRRPMGLVTSFLPSFLRPSESDAEASNADKSTWKERKELNELKKPATEATEATEDSHSISGDQDGQNEVERGRSLDPLNADNKGNREAEFNVEDIQNLKSDEVMKIVETEAAAEAGQGEGEGLSRESSLVADGQYEHYRMKGVGTESSTEEDEEKTNREMLSGSDESMEMAEDQAPEVAVEDRSTADFQNGQERKSYGTEIKSFLPSSLQGDEAEMQTSSADQPIRKDEKEPKIETSKDSYSTGDVQDGQGEVEANKEILNGGDVSTEVAEDQAPGTRIKDFPAEGGQSEQYQRKDGYSTGNVQDGQDKVETNKELPDGGDVPMELAEDQALDVRTEDQSTEDSQGEQYQKSDGNRPVGLLKSLLPSFLIKDESDTEMPSTDKPIGKEETEPATKANEDNHFIAGGKTAQDEVERSRTLYPGNAEEDGIPETDLNVEDEQRCRRDEPMESVETEAEAETTQGERIGRESSSVADGQQHEHYQMNDVGIESSLNEDETIRDFLNGSDGSMDMPVDQAPYFRTDNPSSTADVQKQQQSISYGSRPVALLTSLLPSFLHKDEAEIQTPGAEKTVGEEGNREVESAREVKSLGKDEPMESVEAEEGAGAAEVKPERESEQGGGLGRGDPFTSSNAFTSTLLREVFGEAERDSKHSSVMDNEANRQMAPHADGDESLEITEPEQEADAACKESLSSTDDYNAHAPMDDSERLEAKGEEGDEDRNSHTDFNVKEMTHQTDSDYEPADEMDLDKTSSAHEPTGKVNSEEDGEEEEEGEADRRLAAEFSTRSVSTVVGQQLVHPQVDYDIRKPFGDADDRRSEQKFDSNESMSNQVANASEKKTSPESNERLQNTEASKQSFLTADDQDEQDHELERGGSVGLRDSRGKEKGDKRTKFYVKELPQTASAGEVLHRFGRGGVGAVSGRGTSTPYEQNEAGDNDYVTSIGADAKEDEKPRLNIENLRTPSHDEVMDEAEAEAEAEQSGQDMGGSVPAADDQDEDEEIVSNRAVDLRESDGILGDAAGETRQAIVTPYGQDGHKKVENSDSVDLINADKKGHAEAQFHVEDLQTPPILDEPMDEVGAEAEETGHERNPSLPEPNDDQDEDNEVMNSSAVDSRYSDDSKVGDEAASAGEKLDSREAFEDANDRTRVVTQGHAASRRSFSPVDGQDEEKKVGSVDFRDVSDKEGGREDLDVTQVQVPTIAEQGEEPEAETQTQTETEADEEEKHISLPTSDDLEMQDELQDGGSMDFRHADDIYRGDGDAEMNVDDSDEQVKKPAAAEQARGITRELVPLAEGQERTAVDTNGLVHAGDVGKQENGKVDLEDEWWLGSSTDEPSWKAAGEEQAAEVLNTRHFTAALAVNPYKIIKAGSVDLSDVYDKESGKQELDVEGLQAPTPAEPEEETEAEAEGEGEGEGEGGEEEAGVNHRGNVNGEPFSTTDPLDEHDEVQKGSFEGLQAPSHPSVKDLQMGSFVPHGHDEQAKLENGGSINFITADAKREDEEAEMNVEDSQIPSNDEQMGNTRAEEARGVVTKPTSPVYGEDEEDEGGVDDNESGTEELDLTQPQVPITAEPREEAEAEAEAGKRQARDDQHASLIPSDDREKQDRIQNGDSTLTNDNYKEKLEEEMDVKEAQTDISRLNGQDEDEERENDGSVHLLHDNAKDDGEAEMNVKESETPSTDDLVEAETEAEQARRVTRESLPSVDGQEEQNEVETRALSDAQDLDSKERIKADLDDEWWLVSNTDEPSWKAGEEQAVDFRDATPFTAPLPVNPYKIIKSGSVDLSDVYDKESSKKLHVEELQVPPAAESKEEAEAEAEAEARAEAETEAEEEEEEEEEVERGREAEGDFSDVYGKESGKEKPNVDELQVPTVAEPEEEEEAKAEAEAEAGAKHIGEVEFTAANLVTNALPVNTYKIVKAGSVDLRDAYDKESGKEELGVEGLQMPTTVEPKEVAEAKAEPVPDEKQADEVNSENFVTTDDQSEHYEVQNGSSLRFKGAEDTGDREVESLHIKELHKIPIAEKSMEVVEPDEVDNLTEESHPQTDPHANPYQVSKAYSGDLDLDYADDEGNGEKVLDVKELHSSFANDPTEKAKEVEAEAEAEGNQAGDDSRENTFTPGGQDEQKHGMQNGRSLDFRVTGGKENGGETEAEAEERKADEVNGRGNFSTAAEGPNEQGTVDNGNSFYLRDRDDEGDDAQGVEWDTKEVQTATAVRPKDAGSKEPARAGKAGLITEADESSLSTATGEYKQDEAGKADLVDSRDADDSRRDTEAESDAEELKSTIADEPTESGETETETEEREPEPELERPPEGQDKQVVDSREAEDRENAEEQWDVRGLPTTNADEDMEKSEGGLSRKESWGERYQVIRALEFHDLVKEDEQRKRTMGRMDEEQPPSEAPSGPQSSDDGVVEFHHDDIKGGWKAIGRLEEELPSEGPTPASASDDMNDVEADKNERLLRLSSSPSENDVKYDGQKSRDRAGTEGRSTEISEESPISSSTTISPSPSTTTQGTSQAVIVGGRREKESSTCLSGVLALLPWVHDDDDHDTSAGALGQHKEETNCVSLWLWLTGRVTTRAKDLRQPLLEGRKEPSVGRVTS